MYLHQSNTQPTEIWVSARQLTHHTDSAVATLDLRPLDELGFVGALGDSVFGWLLKPPGFDPAKRYPLIYLIHGGPQGAWTDYWGARWNYALVLNDGSEGAHNYDYALELVLTSIAHAPAQKM